MPSETSPKPANSRSFLLSTVPRRPRDKPQQSRKNLKEPESPNATISSKTLHLRAAATPGKKSSETLKMSEPSAASAEPQPNRTEQNRTKPNANKHEFPPTAGDRAHPVEIRPCPNRPHPPPAEVATTRSPDLRRSRHHPPVAISLTYSSPATRLARSDCPPRSTAPPDRSGRP